MVKILPVVLVFLAMVSVVLYLRFFRQVDLPSEVEFETLTQTTPTPAVEFPAVPTTTPTAAPSAVGGTSNLSALETRVKSLETSLANLQSRVNTLQPTITQSFSSTTTTSKKTPVYIPLGSGGSLNDQSYLTLSSYEASIDPSEYEGYSSMQLEVNLRLVQSAGEAFARLYNVSDSSAIASSEVSTSSDTAALLTSATFKLPAGRKTYRLQAKSTYGFIVELQTARIKVNF